MERVELKDGRVFVGAVVMNTRDAMDLVWTDDGVNMQACIPKDQIAKNGPAMAGSRGGLTWSGVQR